MVGRVIISRFSFKTLRRIVRWFVPLSLLIAKQEEELVLSFDKPNSELLLFGFTNVHLVFDDNTHDGQRRIKIDHQWQEEVTNSNDLLNGYPITYIVLFAPSILVKDLTKTSSSTAERKTNIKVSNIRERVIRGCLNQCLLKKTVV